MAKIFMLCRLGTRSPKTSEELTNPHQKWLERESPLLLLWSVYSLLAGGQKEGPPCSPLCPINPPGYTYSEPSGHGSQPHGGCADDAGELGGSQSLAPPRAIKWESPGAASVHDLVRSRNDQWPWAGSEQRCCSNHVNTAGSGIQQSNHPFLNEN